MRPTAFHLSVASDGVVSLWDTERQARAVEGETYVLLRLTVPQQLAITRARKLATAPNQPQTVEEN